MQLALPKLLIAGAPKGGLRLPPCVPPFNTLTYRLFTALWMVAFALALVGPLAGLVSALSRAGQQQPVAAGKPRRLRGIAARCDHGPLHRRPASGRRRGWLRATISSRSTACRCRRACRSTNERSPNMPTTPPTSRSAICCSAPTMPTSRSRSAISDGQVRDVTVTTGDNHIDDGARSLGMSPKWLNFIDLLHVLAYPFLLWAAWMLHHRNARDAVSSILSLAVLLTMAAEQPASMFLAAVAHSALAQRRHVRPRQRAAADRHPALPARQPVVAAGGIDRFAADFDAASGHALPDLVRLLHDHRRPVVADGRCG